MKTVLSFSVLLAASVVCFSNILAEVHIQAHLPEGARARIGKGSVYGLAFSPDNTQIAAASSIGIWIYDAHTGEALKLLTGHTGRVYSVAFSPDGRTLASGGYDGTILLWDLTTSALNQ